jgi:hypothetical protein
MSRRWISSVHLEKKWIGVWRNYDCSYVEFTTRQLQECITKRKISSITSRGRSIAEFINEYVQQRLQNVSLYTNAGGIQVTYDTMSLLHFFGEPIEVLEERMRALPQVGANQEHYWVSGFYLSSEREVRSHVDRMTLANEMIQNVLTPKGYKTINAFELSAAFTYDTGAQSDGMHLLGPPMKQIVTKLFHHMCSNVVEGSRM